MQGKVEICGVNTARLKVLTQKEMDKLLLEYADGKRENISPRIVAEVMTDKSMVANICTPEQRERFVALMTEILSTYGGEGNGKEKEKT